MTVCGPRRVGPAFSLFVVLLLYSGACSRTGIHAPAPSSPGPEAGPAPAVTVSSPPPVLLGSANLTAGLFHGCVAARGGEVFCWGFNTMGQVCDGSAETSPGAVPVDLPALAVGVSAGREHTCAVDTGGDVFCWGGNRHGELGGAVAAIRSLQPVRVSGLSGVSELSAGGNHSCALSRGGAVRCWGRNDHGQLGGVVAATHRSAIRTPSIGNAARVSAGWLHSCAVMRTGAVACWGDNADQRLGTMEAATDLVSAVPGVEEAVDVSAGDLHSCAVDVRGRAFCWGSNDYGQLGGSRFDPLHPVVRVLGVDDVIEIAAGHEHTCALRSTGAVVCWGRADRGQLGDGGSYRGSPTPVPVPGLVDAVQVDVGWRHGCALRAAGDIWCWGRNVEAQLGRGERRTHLPPAAVEGWSG